MHSAAASSPTAHAHIHAHAHEHAHTYIHIHIHIHLPIPIPMLMSKMTLRGKYLPKSVCQPISFYWCNLCTVVEHPFGSYLTVCGPVEINCCCYKPEALLIMSFCLDVPVKIGVGSFSNLQCLF